jgi:hypothetical protein
LAVPDRSKLDGLFLDISDQELEERLPNKASFGFKKKLQEEAYHLFTFKEWGRFFWMCAKNNGYTVYSTELSYKDESTIKGLMGNYCGQTIKELMEFVWEADHDIVDKKSMGIWILSKGWRQTVFSKFQEWKENGFVDSGKKVREWREDTKKNSLTEPTKKKKSRITIGGKDIHA